MDPQDAQALAAAAEAGFDGLVCRSLDLAERAAVRLEEREVDVIASTADVDAHGEIVEQTFNLKRFKKNGPVLWSHNRGGFFSAPPAAETLPLGFAKNTKVEDGMLKSTLVFVDAEANPFSEQVLQGFAQGSLKAVSIGFRPGKVTEEEDEGGKKRLRLSKNELFEISVVPMGSNPNAVAARRSVEHAFLRKTHGLAPEQPVAASDDDQEKKQMDLDELKAKLAVETARADKAEGLATEAEERAKALDSEAQRLTEKLTASEKDAKELRTKTNALEVDALVGKKIIPGERDHMLELKETNPDLFAKMIADRKEMPHTLQVVPKGAELDPTGGSQHTSDSAADEIDKLANGAAG